MKRALPGAFACLILASCGGGGSQTGTTTGTSPSTPPSGSPSTGSPTPPTTPSTPTTVTNTTIGNLITSQTFPLASTRLYAASRAGAISIVPDVSLDAFNTGITLTYDAVADSYTIIDASNPPTFTQLMKTASSYHTINSTGTYDLTPSMLGITYPTFAASYVAYGTFNAILRAGTSFTDGYFRYFIYGLQTDPAGMPGTGSASYDSRVAATVESLIDNNTNPETTKGYTTLALAGPTSFSVNFAAGTVTFSTTLSNAQSPPADVEGTVTGTGTISPGNVIKGTVSGPNGYTGQFSGAFFGPSAAEVGLSFLAIAPGSGPSTARRLIGVIVGKKN